MAGSPTAPVKAAYLGWPQVSMRTCDGVRQVPVVAWLIDLRRRSVVLAEDDTHLNLLPPVWAS